MPELPEVETIKQELKKEILEKRIKEVIVGREKLIKGISPQIFKSKVEGKFIKEVLRRGKVLIIKLEERLFLIFHLRISGSLILSKKMEKFSAVAFKLEDSNLHPHLLPPPSSFPPHLRGRVGVGGRMEGEGGSYNKLLNFCDARVFGEIRLVDDWQKLPFIKTMGPEPLELKKGEFVELFAGKKGKIKPLLMDQKFLAGVGNIYAQESLFCAGIHPERRADKIKRGELEKIHHCLTSILKEAIKKKGTSVDTYRQINGNKGKYTPFLKVYQRESKPCLNCKTIIKRKVVGGRGTYFCSHCQRLAI